MYYFIFSVDATRSSLAAISTEYSFGAADIGLPPTLGPISAREILVDQNLVSLT